MLTINHESKMVAGSLENYQTHFTTKDKKTLNKCLK